MKISITGHCAGLGQALYKKLKEKHQITGWDILDGWDINQESTRDTIINDLDNQDMFINCAHSFRSQTQLLQRAIEKWDGQNKVIVNISSTMSIIDVSLVYNNMPDHRRHHVTSDQPEDPHSPHNEGAWNMILNGPWPLLFKYMDHNPSIFFKHGGGVPLNWMEVHVYKKFPKLGLLSLLAIDVALFGSLGPWVWVGHIIYGHISEVGFLFLAHWWGYRHYNTGDKSHNIVPWGIILAGEELHNNHHLKATSPKFSHKWYEFDLGWTIIKTLCFLKLAELRYQPDT